MLQSKCVVEVGDDRRRRSQRRCTSCCTRSHCSVRCRCVLWHVVALSMKMNKLLDVFFDAYCDEREETPATQFAC